MRSTIRVPIAILIAAVVAIVAPVAASMIQKGGDPAQAHDVARHGLVTIYGSLADSILANKRCEEDVVRAILEMERGLALGALDRAATNPAALAEAAEHIASFSTEGGATVEPIRNRLLAGGHHHNADDTGPDAMYDSGYVVVDRKTKRMALDLSKECAQLAQAGAASADEIAKIRRELASLAPAPKGK